MAAKEELVLGKQEYCSVTSVTTEAALKHDVEWTAVHRIDDRNRAI